MLEKMQNVLTEWQNIFLKKIKIENKGINHHFEGKDLK